MGSIGRVMPTKASGYLDGKIDTPRILNWSGNGAPGYASGKVSELTLEKELQIRTADGRARRNGVLIKDDDIVPRPQQRLLLPLGF